MGTDGGEGEATEEQQDPKDARGRREQATASLFSHYLRVIVEKFR